MLAKIPSGDLVACAYFCCNHREFMFTCVLTVGFKAYATGTVSTVRSWDYSRTRFTQESARADQGAPRFPPASVLDPPFAGVLDELYENQNRLSELLLGGLAETLELPSETLKGETVCVRISAVCD